METLKQLYDKHKRVINGIVWPDFYETHSYGEVYETILAPYRKAAKNILEIGLFGGDRLRVWEEYFSGKVYGIDCSETPIDGMADLRPMIAEGTHNIHIFDATDAAEVKKRFGKIKFDVILEDAAHNIDQQLQLYNVWKPYLAKESLYFVEDVQDVDNTGHLFAKLGTERYELNTIRYGASVLDLRYKKNRYDDVMVIIR